MIEGELEVPPGLYKSFAESVLWGDMKKYFEECIELNRDLLEGIQTQQEGNRETEEALRGRCRQLREIINYVEATAASVE